MRTGRPIPPLTLTDDERATLDRWARRDAGGQRPVLKVLVEPKAPAPPRYLLASPFRFHLVHASPIRDAA